ncbi:hypothetical protein [Gracilibacillus sp. YIM 98692]|nr:hypothetical protein [Gracilibacillus sp. YIM 98692]
MGKILPFSTKPIPLKLGGRKERLQRREENIRKEYEDIKKEVRDILFKRY